MLRLTPRGRNRQQYLFLGQLHGRFYRGWEEAFVRVGRAA